MNKIIVLITIFIISFLSSTAQEGLNVWTDFIEQLKSDKISPEQIKPIEELGAEYIPTLLSFLDSLRVQASEEDWLVVPEIITQNDKLLFIVPWSTRYNKVTYCLTFLIDDTKWYFQHLEGIFIRLDKYGDLPASKFPDIEETQKTWMRQEIFWSYIVLNFYLPLSKEHGEQYALNLLKDGGGYNVSAKTWVPFLPDHKAFILYLCWEQANLGGNDVTLVKLNDNEAILDIGSYYFALYRITGHLRNQITFDEYQSIFETIWFDRAKYAGWNLDIEYGKDYVVRFRFTR